MNWDMRSATRFYWTAANTLRQSVRATAILTRWGGEEFLILDHVTSPRKTC